MRGRRNLDHGTESERDPELRRRLRARGLRLLAAAAAITTALTAAFVALPR